MAQSELDKLLKAFEDKNTSMEYYILMSIDGIPFKSNIEKNSEVVRIVGLIFDLILYSKKIIEDLKKTNEQGIHLRILVLLLFLEYFRRRSLFERRYHTPRYIPFFRVVEGIFFLWMCLFGCPKKCSGI